MRGFTGGTATLPGSGADSITLFTAPASINCNVDYVFVLSTAALATASNITIKIGGTIIGGLTPVSGLYICSFVRPIILNGGSALLISGTPSTITNTVIWGIAYDQI